MIVAASIIYLVMFTGPENQRVEINPNEVASIRRPRGTDHVSKEIHCIIYTTDGKFISVVETCQEVHDRLAKPQ